jgi:carboxymethylenebutenolidase
MGGGYALVTALNTPAIAGTVICYGRLVTDSATVANIHGPLLGIFGKDDNGIPEASVREFEQMCNASGTQITIHEYDGAGHAFMNPNNTKGYNPTASADAWKHISAFFHARLKL